MVALTTKKSHKKKEKFWGDPISASLFVSPGLFSFLDAILFF